MKKRQLSLIKDIIMGLLICYFIIHNIYDDHQAIFGKTINNNSILIDDRPTTATTFDATITSNNVTIKNIQLSSSSSSSSIVGAQQQSTTTTTTTTFDERKNKNINNYHTDNNDNDDDDDDYIIPLDVLVDTNKTIICPEGLVPIYDQIIPPQNDNNDDDVQIIDELNNNNNTNNNITSLFQKQQQQQQYNNNNNKNNNKIPKIIHMTTKSRCVTKGFRKNIKEWYFPNYSIYIHDDIAIERLLNKYNKIYPQLSIVINCFRNGAMKTDIWRYLILWEYGGIYTDIDNKPGKFFNYNTTISLNDDSFFIVESLGVLSQYFMATSKHHPLMYFAINVCIQRVLSSSNIGRINIPVATGPGALKVAFKYFMKTPPISDIDQKYNAQIIENENKYGRVKEGIYYGIHNRSVTVRGTKEKPYNYIIRSAVPMKYGAYKKMNMTHFSQMAKKKFNTSCYEHLYNIKFQPNLINLKNW